MLSAALELKTTQPLHGVRLDAAAGSSSQPYPLPLTATLRAAKITPVADADPVWLREVSGARFTSRIALYAHPRGWVLDIDCEGRGRFLVHPQGIDIDWDGGTPPEHYLQTLGLAVWLELKGVLCLHANTLASDAGAIGFLAPSQTGKTTLTTAFVAGGWQMLTDDMAALHRQRAGWSVYPSRPEARLWPDMGRHFCGAVYDSCHPVHERFAKRVVPLSMGEREPSGPQPLRRLYLLERDTARSSEITLEPIGAAGALLELLRNSILGDAAARLGIEAQRMNQLAELLTAVPLLRLRYPSGIDQLPHIREAIETDIRSTH